MKNNTELDLFCVIGDFIKESHDPEIINTWEQLTGSDYKLSVLKRAEINRERDKALKEAAETLPCGMKSLQMAKYLLLHIRAFKENTLPYIDATSELNHLEQCLYGAFNTGLYIPDTANGINNILTGKYNNSDR